MGDRGLHCCTGHLWLLLLMLQPRSLRCANISSPEQAFLKGRFCDANSCKDCSLLLDEAFLQIASCATSWARRCLLALLVLLLLQLYLSLLSSLAVKFSCFSSSALHFGLLRCSAWAAVRRQPCLVQVFSLACTRCLHQHLQPYPHINE